LNDFDSRGDPTRAVTTVSPEELRRRMSQLSSARAANDWCRVIEVCRELDTALTPPAVIGPEYRIFSDARAEAERALGRLAIPRVSQPAVVLQDDGSFRIDW
jgi:hypothetical protein